MGDGNLLKSRTCERCGGQVPLDLVKYYPKGINERILLCEKCSQQRETVMKDKLGYRSKMGQSSIITEPRVMVTSKIIPGTKKPEQTLRTLPQQPKAQKNDLEQKAQYFCSRCNYKFPVDEFRIPRNGFVQCPYCGKSDKTKKA